MGVFSGPEITNSGLVLHLDSANEKSLNIPSQADHGFADWYCMVSGTATYSIINSTGGIIYENNAGAITTLVTATTPQRGTITVTAGRTYYGSVPINLVPEESHHAIAPLTMAGTQFFNAVIRFNPTTYNVYAPYDAATVNFYDNTAGGLTGTPTSTLSLSAGQSGTFSSNNLTNHWISSTVPVVVTAIGTSGPGDKTILSPMANYVYQRYASYNGTTNFTTPTVVGTNVIYDNTYKVMSVTIADGSGSDCAQGLGLEYLSDTYSFGNVVSDYGIAAPYSGTVVTTYYWSGSAWIAWDSHTLDGTITSPAYVRRDGTAGPGVDGGTISGGATNMAGGATLWKWEGNKPFYLCINDINDDEFSVLGWIQSRTTTRPRSSTTWLDRSGNNNNGTLVNGVIYSSSDRGVVNFDGINDYISIPNSASLRPATELTIEYVIKGATPSSWCPILGYGNGDYTNGNYLVWVENGGGLNSLCRINNGGVIEYRQYSGVAISSSNYAYMSFTMKIGDAIRSYRNGASSGSPTSLPAGGSFYYGGTSSPYQIVGLGGSWLNGSIPFVRLYNRALSANEIQQNFYAIRGRYGL